MRTIFFCLSMILSLGTLTVKAQDASVSAKAALQRLATAYQQPTPLSFNIVYRYAEQASPTNYLDSLHGQFKLQGHRYWSMLDGQVSVFDGQVLLTIFNEDRLLHLSKPATPDIPGNPLALFDSLLLQYPATSYGYSATAQEEVVRLTLPAGGPCQQISWHIDRATGYLRRMVSLVRADQLYAPSVQPLVDNAASVYVIVETLYVQYQTGDFNTHVFDLQQYLRKEGANYVALGAYAGYQVLVASPSLRQ